MDTPLTKAAIRLKNIEAKELFEVKGLAQNEIAKTIGISEKTVSNWKKVYGWAKKSQNTEGRKKAKELIVVLGYNQKETALMVGVSEKTMCQWNVKYGWQKAREAHLKNISDISSFADGFKVYVMLKYEPFAGGISSLLDNYYHDFFMMQQEVLK